MDAKKLRAKLVEKGYSQRTFAIDMGQNKNTVNATLSGKRIPDLVEAKRMCQLLGIVTDEEKCDIFLS